MELAQAFNWILALIAVVLSPTAPGAQAPLFDVVGRDGYRYTVVPQDYQRAGEAQRLTIVRLGEGDAREVLGTCAPAPGQEPDGRRVAFSGPGGQGVVDMAPLEALAGQLQALDGKAPLRVTIEGHEVVIAGRGGLVYVTDTSTGETFVVRPGATPAPPPPPPRPPRR